ncbi:very short patch repair endonuclease [Streptomyces sp. NPDC047197]|uniref:very short patch repair endonuclease n=1 Tax=Streptomyces sp. NPDC047197 TaxID=3155477 RepID=UPI0033F8BAFD
MSRQPSRDTKPEVAVRRLLHAAGLRYRLQRRVPGMARNTIDIAFPGLRIAVFIDGCFWHGCPEHATFPKSNPTFWREKINKNAMRDTRTTAHLESLGWTVLRFWEHEAPEQVAVQVAAVIRSEKQVGHPTRGSQGAHPAARPKRGANSPPDQPDRRPEQT